jgi:CRP/FNR family transcriptional regulator, anaerobic regulatory protein
MKILPFIDKNLLEDIDKNSQIKRYVSGSTLMNPGDPIEYIPVVLKGSIRVVLQNSEGREHYLYHIFPGETCALSLTCCQTNRISEIKAIIEDDAELMMIPVKFVDDWHRFPEWKKFISDTQSQRFTELLETIELIAFSKLDEQLWSYLVKRVQASGQTLLKITHQEIAQELNSPREVITRLLHQLQSQEKVELSRGAIEVHSSM